MNEYDKNILYEQVKQDIIDLFYDKELSIALDQNRIRDAVDIFIRNLAIMLARYGNPDLLEKYFDYKRSVGFMIEKVRKNKKEMDDMINKWSIFIYLVNTDADPELIKALIPYLFGFNEDQ